MKEKHILVEEQTHKKIKILAAREGMTMKEYIERCAVVGERGGRNDNS